MRLTHRAFDFAMAAHASINQLRKYTGEPYIVHPIAVARLVRSIGGTNEMIAAALLHDVVEDTPVTLNEIKHVFGFPIADLVEQLTDVSVPQDGNRAIRKEIDRKHSARATAEGQTIKLADLIENSRTIAEHDPEFAEVYIPEKRALLEVLTKGNLGLQRQAWVIVDNWEDEHAPGDRTTSSTNRPRSWTRCMT